MKWRVSVAALVLVAGACSDDGGGVFTSAPPEGGETTSTSVVTATPDAGTTTTATTAATGTTSPVAPGPCPIPDSGPTVHLDFDAFVFEGLLGRPSTAATDAALAADGLRIVQADHTGWAGEVGPFIHTEAVIADNPAAVTPDIASLGTSSLPNALRVFDAGHLSIDAHKTLPGRMDFIGFNVGFGHFSEGFERPETVDLEVSVRLLPFHELDGAISEAAFGETTVTLGPGPQPIETCVYLENPGVGHPGSGTWLVDIVPLHPDGTPIHLPVGIDDLFYGCFPGATPDTCAVPPGGLDALVYAHADYSGNAYGLWLADPSLGTGAPLFTYGDNRDLGEPDWSPDGTRIAYVERGDPAGPDNATRNLYVRWMDGSGTTQLTSGGSVWGFDWSPDGDRIVYSLGDDDDNADLWIVDSGGGAPTRMTDLGDDVGAVEPEWSPDGSQIAFERGMRIDGIFWQSELYVMGAGGGSPTLAVSSPSHAGPTNHMHSWSPDGTRLAYSSHYEDGGGVVWVANIATGTEVSVSGAVSEALSPRWSPTGDRIAFFGFSGDAGLWVVNADGSGLTPLPATPQWGTDISWSAGGDRLAYTGSTPASGDGVWVIATDGSPPVQVTTLVGREYDADWSP